MEGRPYAPGDLAGAALAVAATDDRAVNRAVGEEAKVQGIPVSVADCPEECTFFFPAVCTGENLVAGVIGRGDDHARTARAAGPHSAAHWRDWNGRPYVSAAGRAGWRWCSPSW